MTKILVAFRNFPKSPNEHNYSYNLNSCIVHVSLVFAETVGVLLLMISAILNCLWLIKQSGPITVCSRKSLAISLSVDLKFRYLKIRKACWGGWWQKGCRAGVVVFQNKGNGDFEWEEGLEGERARNDIIGTKELSIAR